jgi:hypothetical protein
MEPTASCCVANTLPLNPMPASRRSKHVRNVEPCLTAGMEDRKRKERRNVKRLGKGKNQVDSRFPDQEYRKRNEIKGAVINVILKTLNLKYVTFRRK